MKAITFLRYILAFQQAAQMKCHILADIEILLRAVSSSTMVVKQLSGGKDGWW